MKKLIWKVLKKNAQARRADRSEAKFASLFFYQLIMKRSIKAFKMYQSIVMAKKSNAMRVMELMQG